MLILMLLGLVIMLIVDLLWILYFHGASPIAWKSKQQSAVSWSSAEAELRALATTTAEIIWLHWLLADFGVTCVDPTILRCDNSSAI
jgi:hypothetical protein